jgi:hypothetical protein
MRLFYCIKTKHLIAVPFRNGSTFLHENMRTYNIIDVTYPPIFASIINEVDKKTFIYRDPLLRLMSFYNLFIYSESIDKVKDAKYLKLFMPPTRGKDLFSDMVLAKNKIEANYKNDSHTLPQYEFFKNELLKQNIEEYEIISANQYTKWLMLTFTDKVEHKLSAIDKINLNVENFLNMNIIHDICKNIYQEDYKFLEPRVTLL